MQNKFNIRNINTHTKITSVDHYDIVHTVLFYKIIIFLFTR